MPLDRDQARRQLWELRGVNLHELARRNEVTIEKDGRQNKGWAGHAIERHLGLPINSAQSPNFGSWELKCIPANHKNGQWRIKETMAITMIDPFHVKKTDFYDSHLFTKLRRLLIVVRSVGCDFRDPSEVLKVIEFDPDDETMDTIRLDYELVQQAIRIGGLTSLTGRMGVFVQPRTKGAGHGSISRAFYARRDFLQRLFDES
jgi:DNA mismatch repair protein MutH